MACERILVKFVFSVSRNLIRNYISMNVFYQILSVTIYLISEIRNGSTKLKNNYFGKCNRKQDQNTFLLFHSANTTFHANNWLKALLFFPKTKLSCFFFLPFFVALTVLLLAHSYEGKLFHTFQLYAM